MVYNRIVTVQTTRMFTLNHIIIYIIYYYISMNIDVCKNLDKYINLKDGENIYHTLNDLYQSTETNYIRRILFLDIDGILVTDKESDSKRDSKNYIWAKSGSKTAGK